MSVDICLKIDDVKGESVRKSHEDEIDVLQWTWGMTQSGSTHIATGSGSGKVAVADIHFTKRVDKATPVLIAYCCSGQHFKKATMTVMKAGGDAWIDYVIFELEDIIIASYQTGSSSGGDDLILESISLNFGRYTLKYQQQKADGSKLGGTVDQAWDIAKNVKM